ncbi:MAG: hypothetical protein ACOYVK_11080 [Bacillota bacterium]
MCYKIEELQELIDHEFQGDVQAAMAHINTCPTCTMMFERLKNEEKIIENALKAGMVIPKPVKMDANTITFLKEKKKVRRIFPMNTVTKRWTVAAAVVVLCGGLFFFEPVRATAQELLKLFRVQEITGISISQSDLYEIEKLFQEGNGQREIPNFGHIDVSSQGKEVVLENPDGIDEIKEKMPDALLMTAPDGFEYQYVTLIPKTDVTLTLDVKKVNDFLTYLGEEVQLPQAIDQKAFTIHTNNVLNYSIVQDAKEEGKEVRTIHISQIDAPGLEIPEGVDERQLIQSLFSMSFLPKNLKEQLMGIQDITTTLPIPYHAEQETKKDITVRGNKAILIEPINAERDYFRLYFKEQNKLYFVDGYNYPAAEVLSLIEAME